MKQLLQSLALLTLCIIFLSEGIEVSAAWERTGTFQILDDPNFCQNHGLIGVAMNEDNNHVYVSGIRTQGLLVIDGKTNKRLKVIPLPRQSSKMGLSNVAWSPVTDRIYVTAPDQEKVHVLDAVKEEYLRNFEMKNGSRGIDVDRKTGKIFITQYGEGWEGGADTVVVLDKDEKVLKTITVQTRPWELCVDSEEGKTYVACKGEDNYKPGYLCVIDNDSLELVATIPVGRRPRCVGVNTKTRRAYVACRFSSAVYVVDIDRHVVVDRVVVDCDPIGIVVPPGQNDVYVVNRQGAMRLGTPYRGTMATVSIIDGAANKVKKTLTIGKTGHYVVFNPHNKYIYMPTEDSSDVWMVDTKTNEVAGNIKMGLITDEFYLNPKTGFLYTTSHISDEMIILDGRGEKLVAIVPTGGWPHSCTGLPNIDRIYVNESDKAMLSVFHARTHKFIKSIDLGVEGHFCMNSPIVEAHTFLWSKIAADNQRNRILVTCPWVEKLAIVDGRTGHIEYVDLGFSAKAVDYGILDVAIDEQRNVIYVWNSTMSKIVVIDGENLQVLDWIDVVVDDLGRRERLVVDASNQKVYLGRLTIDCRTNQVIGSFRESVKGWVHLTDQQNNRLYVSEHGSNLLTMVDASTYKILDRVEFESGTFIAADREKGRIYVDEGRRGIISVYTK